jgi:hypothetical protein
MRAAAARPQARRLPAGVLVTVIVALVVRLFCAARAAVAEQARAAGGCGAAMRLRYAVVSAAATAEAVLMGTSSPPGAGATRARGDPTPRQRGTRPVRLATDRATDDERLRALAARARRSRAAPCCCTPHHQVAAEAPSWCEGGACCMRACVCVCVCGGAAGAAHAAPAPRDRTAQTRPLRAPPALYAPLPTAEAARRCAVHGGRRTALLAALLSMLTALRSRLRAAAPRGGGGAARRGGAPRSARWRGAGEPAAAADAAAAHRVRHHGVVGIQQDHERVEYLRQRGRDGGAEAGEPGALPVLEQHHRLHHAVHLHHRHRLVLRVLVWRRHRHVPLVPGGLGRGVRAYGRAAVGALRLGP